ncbi:MAG: hypothetical protein ACQESN_11720 [Thermotogota bacterium]
MEIPKYIKEQFSKLKNKEEIDKLHQKLLEDVRIFGTCKDGSGSQVKSNLYYFKEYFNK